MIPFHELNLLMLKAEHIADRDSDDIERHVGAVVHGASRKLTAANTFVELAKGLPNTKPDKYEYMIHAEANLVFTAAREGVKLEGTTVVCTLSPCKNCIRAMFQAGIREVYWRDVYEKNGVVLHDTNMRDIKVTETLYGLYTYMKLENW